MSTGVFVAEEVDAVRDKGSGDKTTVDVQALLVAILNMSLRSVSFTDEAFSRLKSKTSGLGMIIKCPIIRISGLSNFELKECYCNILFYSSYVL